MADYYNSQFDAVMAEYNMVSVFRSIQYDKINILKECGDDTIMYYDSINILTEGFINKAVAAIKKFLKKIWEYIQKAVKYIINTFRKRWRDVQHYINLIRSKFTKMPVLRTFIRPFNSYLEKLNQVNNDIVTAENVITKVMDTNNITVFPSELTDIMNRYNFNISNDGRIRKGFVWIGELLPEKEYISIYDPLTYVEDGIKGLESCTDRFKTHQSDAERITKRIEKYMEREDIKSAYDDAKDKHTLTQQAFDDASHATGDHGMTFGEKGMELGIAMFNNEQAVPPIIMLQQSSKIINGLVEIYRQIIREATEALNDVNDSLKHKLS